MFSQDQEKNKNSDIYSRTYKRPPKVEVDFIHEMPIAPPSQEILNGYLLRSPKSLAELVGPKDLGIKKSASTQSIKSPVGSPSISRSNSFAIFPKDVEERLFIRTFPYENIDKEIALNEHDLQELDNLPNIIRIPKEFLYIMQLQWRRHSIFATWRLASYDPSMKSNRRISLVFDGERIYSPKETNTSTQTGSTYEVCGGHIARDARFRDKDYRIKDNNHSGSFHHSAKYQPGKKRLLTFLKTYDSANIIDVKFFADSLMTFSELVKIYDKNLNPVGESIKIYIQEPRTVFYVLDIIEQKKGIFVNATAEKISFKDSRDNLCFLDLTKTIPKLTSRLPKINTSSFIEFKNYIQKNELEDFHAPVFNSVIRNGKTLDLPIMVLAGKNGLPICGDIDPEHIAERRDAPEIIYKSFNGINDNPNKFLCGLEILYARLTCKNEILFKQYIKALGSRINSLKNGSDIIDSFKEYFTENNDLYDVHGLYKDEYNQYTDYTLINYYKDTYLPIVVKTWLLYQTKPELLKLVGESSIGCLVIQNDSDHEAFMHDADNLNPSTKLSEMGSTFFYYEHKKNHPNGKLCVTGNEESYVKFLLHDPEILKNNRISIHPYRIAYEGTRWHETWLDIIRIQALLELSSGVDKFTNYWRIVLEDYNKRDLSETKEIAIIKTNNIFKEFIHVFGNKSTIDNLIKNIYEKYKEDSDYICSKLRANRC